MDVTLTRAKFDELTHDLVQATMGPVNLALKDADLDASEIDKVLLVGGSTRVPAVQAAVYKLTGKDPFKGINQMNVLQLVQRFKVETAGMQVQVISCY